MSLTHASYGRYLQRHPLRLILFFCLFALIAVAIFAMQDWLFPGNTVGIAIRVAGIVIAGFFLNHVLLRRSYESDR